jgi:peptidoglycan hydrolase-like protein with peptidoglycan-binding domain
MSRDYTGWDYNATGKRAGAEALSKCLEAYFGVWNNGTWGVRNMRGKGKPSVHGTGRAGDNSWRGAPYRGTGNYDSAKAACEFLVEHADELGLEFLCDYFPKPWGRGWRCDRNAWQDYTKKTVSGTPGGDWIHWEISNETADDPDRIVKVFEDALGPAPEEVKVPAKKTPKAPAGKKPWLQVGSKGAEVKKVQEIVGATADGDYGPKTEQAVKNWQAEHDLHVDGIWGPGSDGHVNDCDHGAPEPAAAPAPAPAANPFPGESLQIGSTGKYVIMVQKKVGAKPDGRFGPVTARSVRKYQRNAGLTVDGVVGPKTWGHMF